jgi:sulfite reductase (NADPH) hemoprotein beta-component
MKAITANRLVDGEVVFWKAGAWVDGFGDAQLFDEGQDAEVEAVVVKAKAQATVIVDPYPIDLVPVDGRLAPVSYRERIRALGPSNEPTHGKQAVGGEVIEALRHAVGAARSTGRIDLIRRK